MSFRDAMGYIASALVIAAFGMKVMVPPRALAVCSDFVFSTRGAGQ